jgi:hypothetical protein
MKIPALILSIFLFPCLVNAQAIEQFDPKNLSGWWAESSDTSPACTEKNRRFKFEFLQRMNLVIIKFDKKIKTGISDVDLDEVAAIIVSSTSKSLVIKYSGETRKKTNGKPIEWELAIVAPGVYRWRETDWPLGEANGVVGIKCSD